MIQMCSEECAQAVVGKIFFFLSLFHAAALIVRFLTKRFIGDYEANTGEPTVLWETEKEKNI